MKIVLFDLGNTLEVAGVLRPGAMQTLQAIAALHHGDGPDGAVPDGHLPDGDGHGPLLGLVSDFDMPADPADIPAIQRRYYELLDQLGIRDLFEPVAQRVTLSTEVGQFKPAEAVFRTAVAKSGPTLALTDALFVTENLAHVLAARRLGLKAVHIGVPGGAGGEVDTLPELVPLVRAFLDAARADEVHVHRATDAAAARAITSAAESAGATWTRLGDAIVVTGDGAALRSAATTAGAEPEARPGVPRSRLHLVTQNGRQFQQEHPHVPVVVDRGRYLVVDLDPRDARQPAREHVPCYRIQGLPEDTVVFSQVTPALARRPAAVAEAERIEAVSRIAFEADLRKLAGFRTRHSTSAEFLSAAEWAESELRGLGYATSVQPVPVQGGTTRNVIAERPGSDGGRQVVVVTAHLDSINVRDGAAAPAPGADDNGSGSAGLLGIARALSDHTGARDLRLILFGGEEQGLFGSLHHVAGLDDAERARIHSVLNMDMIAGRNTPVPTVLLEGAAGSQGVIDALAAAAHSHTGLAVQTSLMPFNSDHVPFIEVGIPAVLTIEGADGANDRIHTARDTLDHIDHDLAVEILRMNVAYLVQALDQI